MHLYYYLSNIYRINKVIWSQVGNLDKLLKNKGFNNQVTSHAGTGKRKGQGLLG